MPVARVIGLMVPVSCSNIVHRMRKLWFLGSCLCSEGCYYAGHPRSPSIGTSQRTLLDTLPGISWWFIHFIHLHRLYLVSCGLLSNIFQLSHLDGCFKFSVIRLCRLIFSLPQIESGSHGHNFRIIPIWCMIYAICTHLELGKKINTIVCWKIDDILWVSLQLALECWGSLSPKYPVDIDYVLL